jgi:hypothetical protein
MTNNPQKTAYQIQFQGSYTPFRIGKLWKAKTEPMVKLFRMTGDALKVLDGRNLGF